MTEEVQRWSEELARDPSSLVFLPLAETLRRRGQLDLALQVAGRGVERHPHNADAHDQLARIHADRGELAQAADAWATVLRLVSGHVGALKGMAFVRFQQGDYDQAERLLMEAQEHGAGDDLSAAIHTVRQSGALPAIRSSTPGIPADPRLLFSDLLADDQTAVMLDKDGLVLAGAYFASDGRDVAEDIGAILAGVPAEAQRATRHLAFGQWRAIVFETEAAVVALTPAPSTGTLGAGGLMLLAASPSTPLGRLRLQLDACVARAIQWLGGGA